MRRARRALRSSSVSGGMSSPPSVCFELEDVDEECVEASMMFLAPGSEK